MQRGTPFHFFQKSSKNRFRWKLSHMIVDVLKGTKPLEKNFLSHESRSYDHPKIEEKSEIEKKLWRQKFFSPAKNATLAKWPEL